MNDTNSNGTTVCRYDYCIEVQLHQQILGTIIFVIVWPFIVMDYKKFPLGRPSAALIGATLMVVTSVVPQAQVFAILGDKGNLQTLCLLLGMMFLSFYYEEIGLLHVLTFWIFGKNKPFHHVLWKVCILSAVLSAIITNDAACVTLTPILLKEHKNQKRSTKEFSALLLGIATSANIGSAATFFGNPQNAFIAASSKNEISLATFFATTLPAAVLGVTLNVLLLYARYYRILFRRQCNKKEEEEISEPPKLNGEAAVSNEESVKINNSTEQKLSNSASFDKKEYDSEKSFTDKTWQDWLFLVWLISISVVVVVLLAIPPSITEFNLGLVPVGAAILTMLLNTILRKVDPRPAITQVDWGLLLMFIGLFVWLQGFENTGFLDQLFDFILPYMNLNTFQGVLLFVVAVSVGSNIISNVPLVILVVHNLFEFMCGDNICSIQLTGILLAWVSTIAGNSTLIGSVANLIVAEKGRECANYRLSFITYLKYGFLSTVIIMFVPLPIVYFSGKYVSI